MLTDYAKRKSELINKAIANYQENIDALTAEKNAVIEKYKALIEDETKVCTEFIKYYKECIDRLKADKKALKTISGSKAESEPSVDEDKVVDTLFPDNNATPVVEETVDTSEEEEEDIPDEAFLDSQPVEETEEEEDEVEEDDEWEAESDEESDEEFDDDDEEESDEEEEEESEDEESEDDEDNDGWPEVPEEW